MTGARKTLTTVLSDHGIAITPELGADLEAWVKGLVDDIFTVGLHPDVLLRMALAGQRAADEAAALGDQS